MRNRRAHLAAVATLAAGVLVLSACSDDGGGGEEATTDDGAGLVADSSIDIAWNQPFFSYNANSATGNAVANVVIKTLINSGFNYYDPELVLTPDESFGSYEIVNEDPLQIAYTFADTAMWADGVPSSPADFILEWAAQSGKFTDVEAEYDEEGNITNQEALDAGVFFDAASACAALITDTPEIDGSTITLTYSEPFADWETCIGPNLPAHIVGQRALGIDDPAEAAQAVTDAIVEGDTEALSSIAQVWSNDFNYTSLPDEPGLYLSNGSYEVTEFVEGQYMTMEANENYEGAFPASIETVTVRWIEDPLAAVQALQNGEVDVINPQSTADVLQALEADADLEVETQEQATYEHVDLQFTNGGPFDPATYGGDEATALAVRQAFLHTIPRQQIVDNLIIPLNPNATVRNSFTQIPGSPNYDPIVEANGMADTYGEVDTAAATALLEEAGVETPVQVRLLFDPANTRRVNEYELIAASAEEAGFEVVPYELQTDWGTDLSNATSFYDAALFGWSSSSTAVTGSSANYYSGERGGNNYYGYVNEEVDALQDELNVTTDEARQTEILAEVETHLMDDAFGITIFQFPGITAWDPTQVGNLQPSTLSASVFANYWEWTAGDQG